MKTPDGRRVLVDAMSPTRPGYFQFRCEGLELIVKLHADGKASIYTFNPDQKIEETPVLDNWKAAEKAVFELFDETRKQ